MKPAKRPAKSDYQKRMEWWQSHPRDTALLKWLYKLLPAGYMVSFPLLLFLLWYRDKDTLLPFSAPFMVCAVCLFVLVGGSLLRAALNRPRPYEAANYPSLFHKTTVGHSFPSRHAFCAAVIGVCWWYYQPVWGLFWLLVAVAICATRVLAGVHYLRDVLAGFAFGGICGWIGLYLLK